MNDRVRDASGTSSYDPFYPTSEPRGAPPRGTSEALCAHAPSPRFQAGVVKAPAPGRSRGGHASSSPYRGRAPPFLCRVRAREFHGHAPAAVPVRAARLAARGARRGSWRTRAQRADASHAHATALVGATPVRAPNRVDGRARAGSGRAVRGASAHRAWRGLAHAAACRDAASRRGEAVKWVGGTERGRPLPSESASVIPR